MSALVDPDRLETPPLNDRGRVRQALERPALRAVLGAIVPVGLFVLWYAAAANGWMSPVLLPSPSAVVHAARELLDRSLLWGDVWTSGRRVLAGFVIGSVIGIVVGALIGLSRLAEAVLAPTIGAFRAVPSLAWVPLLLLWLKIGETSKITLIAIGALFPVLTTVSLALKHVDRLQVEAARAFGVSGVRLFATVQLPAVVPSVFAGLRLALAQSWLFVVAAELIASSKGLGYLLTQSQNIGRTDEMFLAIVLLAVLGKFSDTVLGFVERSAVRRWA